MGVRLLQLVGTVAGKDVTIRAHWSVCLHRRVLILSKKCQISLKSSQTHMVLTTGLKSFLAVLAENWETVIRETGRVFCSSGGNEWDL